MIDEPQSPDPNSKGLSNSLQELIARGFSQGRFGLRHLKHGERGAALSASSALDRILQELLMAALSEDKYSLGELFKPNRSLSNMTAKAHLAFLMGLITKEVRTDILSIARIRNLFAHNEDAETFTHPAIATEVEKLKTFDVDQTIKQIEAFTSDESLRTQFKEQVTGGFAFEWNIRSLIASLEQATIDARTLRTVGEVNKR